MRRLKRSIILICFAVLICGCKPTFVSKKLSEEINNDFFNNQFTGILVYNPKTKDTIFKYNADKFFVPASNAKIFTLYSALSLLPEKIPAFKYSVKEDGISILGTGDPTFLHPYFNDSTALKMAEKFKKVNLVLNNLSEDKFGPGWAWEDYDAYFSPERSSFPMYGNVLTISNQDSLKSIPSTLKNNIQLSKAPKRRKYNENSFFFNANEKETIEVPMVIDTILVSKLWNAILPEKVSLSNYSGEKMEHIAYSVPSDSLYKRMMLVSDNFLAEQILILASSTISDTLSPAAIRVLVLNNQLQDLKQKPRWVDGSGLSRYNLFTPTSFVQVLDRLYKELPQERLFNLFPVGGQSGTIKNYYKGNTKPYLYAKSGSLDNNYSLSGYLLTNSGKTLIFSFMNNHFTVPTAEVKKRMQAVFEWLRDNY
ncbi:D-alanyl-D-alanine carboxypeptidase/D-alanyl-D-alanine-endopeptidase [Mariniflexile aquimaris]|uniref:D-alanyl-D-alanine carboxypeptidase/D-alanyl-D-alanine-endopeptidase n=1 Tax=Mariniflexile aquimaris TaxID=881009 RepID=A0ABW3BPE7_9FLAO